MIILCRELKPLSVSRQGCNDAAVFLGQPRDSKRPAEVIPFQCRLLYQSNPLGLRQIVDGTGEGPNSFLHTLIGRRELEPRVKGFQMRAEFLAEGMSDILLRSLLVRHDALNDTVGSFTLTMG